MSSYYKQIYIKTHHNDFIKMDDWSEDYLGYKYFSVPFEKIREIPSGTIDKIQMDLTDDLTELSIEIERLNTRKAQIPFYNNSMDEKNEEEQRLTEKIRDLQMRYDTINFLKGELYPIREAMKQGYRVYIGEECHDPTISDIIN